MVVTVAVGSWLASLADTGLLVRASAAAAACAALVLAAGLAFRFAAAVPVAIALLGAEYAALLVFEDGALDVRAPLVAVALFGVAELGYWSLELRAAVVDEPGTYLRRIAVLAGLLLLSLALGAGLLALVESAPAGGIALDLLGAAAAVGALALLTLASRRDAS